MALKLTFKILPNLKNSHLIGSEALKSFGGYALLSRIEIKALENNTFQIISDKSGLLKAETALLLTGMFNGMKIKFESI